FCLQFADDPSSTIRKPLIVNISRVLCCQDTTDTKGTSLLDQYIQCRFASRCIRVSRIESCLSTTTADLIQEEQKTRLVSTGSATLLTHPRVNCKGNLGNNKALIFKVRDVSEADNADLRLTVNAVGSHQLLNAHLLAPDPVSGRADELPVYRLCKLLTSFLGDMVIDCQHANGGEGRFQNHRDQLPKTCLASQINPRAPGVLDKSGNKIRFPVPLSRGNHPAYQCFRHAGHHNRSRIRVLVK